MASQHQQHPSFVTHEWSAIVHHIFRRSGYWSSGMLLRLTIVCLILPCCIHPPFPVNAATSRASRSSEKHVLIPDDQQMLLNEEARIECFRRIVEDPYPQTGQLYCNRTWDNIMCWPDVPAGQLSLQPCPRYINMFRTDAYASRFCLPDGTWFVHPLLNRTWTNYIKCADNITTHSHQNARLMMHVGRIKAIYHVGYGLSIIMLIAAIAIMTRFKKLRCPRNTLHINLFASFILRAMLSFLRESLLVSGLGLPKDIYRTDNGTVLFREDVMHWECRLLMAVFNYAISTNYMWIFVEGLYLHTLIFMEVFLESSCVTWYIVFGWVASLTFVLPWVVVRALLENVYCWNTHPTPGYFWIIKLPTVITVLVNFVFFVNIVRVLFTKLNAMSTADTTRHKHRKLAKSTLVLIPLFGVPYVLFVGLPDNLNETMEIVKLYFEMTFNSFNGFVVAMLFCFLNGEVQNEFQKLWELHRLRSSDLIARRRHSRTLLSTTGVNSPKTVHSHAGQPMVTYSSPQAVTTPTPQRCQHASEVEESIKGGASSVIEWSDHEQELNPGPRKDTQVLFLMSDTLSTVVEVDKEQRQPFLNSSIDIYF